MTIIDKNEPKTTDDKAWELLDEMAIILSCEKKPRGYKKFLERWRKEAYAMLLETGRREW